MAEHKKHTFHSKYCTLKMQLQFLGCGEVLSDSPSFLEWRTADRRGLHSNDALTASMFCGSANCFNTATFLLNSWAGLFKVVYRRLYGMSWRHFTVSMNPEFLAKFTSGCNVAIVVLIKWFYGESTRCAGPRLHFTMNAIHGHATWQHHSPSSLKLKIEKRRCQIARFTGGPCITSLTERDC